MSAKNKTNEIAITRLYDAPVDVVWDAWTDPAQVAQWWGPRGFTLTTHSKDLKVGGIWHYTMHGPDGTDYVNKTLYHEVVEHQKLVYDHGGNDERAPLFHVTVLFSQENGKTRMDMTMALPTPEAAEQTRKFIKAAGGNATWDRLAEFLEKEKTGKENFVINRTFDVPVDVMFDVWTNPDHLAQWMGPKGFDMDFIDVDIRTGGKGFYYMASGTGNRMYGKTQYLKVEKPDTLVYTQQFCDEQGKTTRHPMAPTWPETMLTAITFASEGPHKTRVTITWSLMDDVTAEELQTFITGRTGMTQGWTGSLDKLEEYLQDKKIMAA